MDTDLSDHSGLEGLRADHPNRTVPELPVVVHLDVLEHLPAHGISGLESLAMDRFDLEAVEAALGTGIVVAVALGTHAALEVVPGQHPQVEPSFTGRQIGDVADPFLIRGHGSEILLQQVGRHRQRVSRVRRRLELARLTLILSSLYLCSCGRELFRRLGGPLPDLTGTLPALGWLDGGAPAYQKPTYMIACACQSCWVR